MVRVFEEDFSSFNLGPFPYDREHSAMGEYHYYPDAGYKGAWYDPIVDFDYRGYNWLITSPRMDGKHVMEQMRVKPPRDRKAAPVLRAGDVNWKNYTLTVEMRPMVKDFRSGILFRYQTSMMHYGLFLTKDGVSLERSIKCDHLCIAKKQLDWSLDKSHCLKAVVKDNLITCYLDDELLFSMDDDTYSYGCIALSADMPTQYSHISVDMEEEDFQAFERDGKAKETSIQEKRKLYSRPKLLRKIELKDFGAGRQLRWGHLTGTDELFGIICQPQLKVFKDRYPVISCMTAFSLETGDILWQIGEPRDCEDVVNLTTDLPFQIYDIDNDGIDEVITSWDFKLFILDGRTGGIKKSIDTPMNVEPPESVTSLEFGRYAYNRLNVDAIRIANISGKDRPEDILIKDRYARIWIYDKDLNFKWKFSKYNTGHFPYTYDIDGDGKDEVFSCYNMIDHDGSLLWSLPITTDNTDEIVIGRIDPDIDDEIITMVSGWEGFMIVDKKGNILHRDINGHGQRISVGNFIPSQKGLEICTTTYWGHNNIIYMHDCKGNEIWHKEMLCNGNIIAPVNWNGDGKDLILLNGSAKQGGLMDGDGDLVVELPDDGHPELCSIAEDIYGDSRDEIIVWDRKSLWIYTQEEEMPKSEQEYCPIKYPSYNNSNYRGEFCFPNWKRK